MGRKEQDFQYNSWGAANGGLRNGGLSIWGKGLFPALSGFSRCSSDPLEKGEKANLGQFPGRAARHPLNPHLLHPHVRQFERVTSRLSEELQGPPNLTYPLGPAPPPNPPPPRWFWPDFWELRNIYHHHPESKKRKSSEANSGSMHPYGRHENAVKTRKTISTIAILWPVKAIFEKRAATVEVDTLISPVIWTWIKTGSESGPGGVGLAGRAL